MEPCKCGGRGATGEGPGRGSRSAAQGALFSFLLGRAGHTWMRKAPRVAVVSASPAIWAHDAAALYSLRRGEGEEEERREGGAAGEGTGVRQGAEQTPLQHRNRQCHKDQQPTRSRAPPQRPAAAPAASPRPWLLQAPLLTHQTARLLLPRLLPAPGGEP